MAEKCEYEPVQGGEGKRKIETMQEEEEEEVSHFLFSLQVSLVDGESVSPAAGLPSGDGGR